ncbi:MAG: M23 family metallopeptidase [Spirochaetales bacterium]|nr:M23 family metallopeptidase [Spirochaetales bacterium]
MEIENKTAGYWGGEVPSLSRPKPFVTILDGTTLSTSPKRRKAIAKPRPQRLASARKQSTRLHSYASETAHGALKSLGSALGKAAASIAAFLAALTKSPAGIAAFLKARAAPKKIRMPDMPFTGTAANDAAADEIGLPLATEAAAAPAAARRRTPLLARLASIIAFLRLSRVRRILPIILVSVLVLTAGAAAIIGAAQFPVSVSGLVLPDEESAQALLMAYIAPEGLDKDNLSSASLPPIPLAVTISAYTVRCGDTLEKIAKRFGLRQDTIISLNNLQSASSIRSGLKLRIPNMDGVSHKVRRGESLSSLSKTYAIDMTRIVDANDLSSSTIAIGQSLFIPNARLSSASLKQFYGMQFQWPARGPISSPFGYRANPFTGLRTFHSAIDIVVSVGTNIRATIDGRVADTGYNSVFGNYIIIKHDSGYQSLYAHLSKIIVKEGSYIDKGSVIGLSGNTGQSTGPHLHFSLFKNGQALDPIKYIK